jgi:hypothetical protein
LFFVLFSSKVGAEKNDPCYLRAVLERMIKDGRFGKFDRVDFFSDGGPRHFKQKYGMHAMSEWFDLHRLHRPDKPIPTLVWNITAPHHGHGVADSHAGVASQKFTREKLNRQFLLGELALVPKDATELRSIMNQMKNTKAIVLPSIQRPQYRTDLETLQCGIRSVFQIHFVTLPALYPHLICSFLGLF